MKRVEALRESILTNEGLYINSRANIFYYSGFTSEDARLVITPKECLLFTDSRYTIQAKNQARDFAVCDIGDLEKIIKDIGVESLGFEEDYLTVKELYKLNKIAQKVFPAGTKISNPRRVKDKKEISKIAAAEALGDAAFSYIIERIKPGISEHEIALDLEYFMRKNGAEGLSFETIAASGKRSAMPHGVASDKQIEKGDFLTLDFGCVLDGYCSDMTRTVIIGAPSIRQREIYDIVLNAQMTACEKISEGMECRVVDAVARDIIANGGFGDNFGHSLGHSVGIEIHETPNLSPKSEDILVPGNVVTVEPGIYIEDFGGVRIEDLVVIGEKNTVNLTKSPKELIII